MLLLRLLLYIIIKRQLQPFLSLAIEGIVGGHQNGIHGSHHDTAVVEDCRPTIRRAITHRETELNHLLSWFEFQRGHRNYGYLCDGV